MDRLLTLVVEPCNTREVKKLAGLSRQYWWGQHYPKDPLEDLQRAKCIYAMYDRRHPVGCVAIFNGDYMEISHLVVHPRYRGKRVAALLFGLAMAYMHRHQIDYVQCATECPSIRDMLVRKEWTVVETRARLDNKIEWVLSLKLKK